MAIVQLQSDNKTHSCLVRPPFDNSLRFLNLVGADVCVSCTTDDGQYAMFDTRAEMVAPAVQADTDKADLFTHARYSDHHLLLGYGDGEMKQLDMRKPAEMSDNISTALHRCCLLEILTDLRV